MFALLKQIDPPLGFGSKCPDLLSYKRLVRMNMPIDDEGRVNFTTTLFALVRVNLQERIPPQITILNVPVSQIFTGRSAEAGLELTL